MMREQVVLDDDATHATLNNLNDMIASSLLCSSVKKLEQGWMCVVTDSCLQEIKRLDNMLTI